MKFPSVVLKILTFYNIFGKKMTSVLNKVTVTMRLRDMYCVLHITTFKYLNHTYMTTVKMLIILTAISKCVYKISREEQE